MAEKETKRRTNLSLMRKILLIKRVEEGKKKKDVADEFGVTPGTVTHILKDKEKLRELYNGGTVDVRNKRPQRGSVHKELENALYLWYSACKNNSVVVSSSLMKQTAEEFAKDMGKPGWKCSYGWRQRFYKRHNINFRKGSAEGESFDQVSLDTWIAEVLMPILQRFQEKDIFSMDECGLFWRVLPDQAMALENIRCRGGKKSKERMTVTLCCNMDGSEKWPLMVIGKFRTPRCFQGIRKLPLQYESSPKAWVTSELFESWLRAFDHFMNRRKRKVLLVLDSCSSHMNIEDLKSTELLFLPPNATCKLQPCNTGIIKNFKFHYRTMMLSKLMQHVDSGLAIEDFHFSLLDAVATLKSAWEQVTVSTVQTSFREAGFYLLLSHRHSEGRIEPRIPSNMESGSELLGVDPLLSMLYANLNISMDKYCNFDNNLTTCEPPLLTDSVTVPATVPPVVSGGSNDSNMDDCGEELLPVSNSQVLSALSTVELYLMQTGGACSDDLTSRFHNFKAPFEQFVLGITHE